MKKINYTIFIFFMILLGSLSANEPLITKKKAPLSIALPLLKSIEEHSIVVGRGATHVYAFIDPICPRSREFVEMIFENSKMQKSYTYHLFYYELTRFHSKDLIRTIYMHAQPLLMLKKVMIDKKTIQCIKDISPKVQTQMNDISKIAQKLDIYKRPYLFVVKPKKGDS